MSLPFDLGMGGGLYMALACIIAAFVRGYSGFGFSALLIAASGLVTNPLNVVAVVVVCEFLMSAQLWRRVGPDVDWSRVLALTAGAVVGLPLGLWILTAVPENAARAAISLYILVMCAVLLAGWKIARPMGRRENLLAGVASGLANAPGMGGLPVVAYFAAQGIQASVFRATLVAYFPILDIYSAPLYWLNGMVTADTFWAALWAIPFVFFGNWLGGRHFLNTDPQDFRRFAILLLAGLAALGLVKSVL